MKWYVECRYWDMPKGKWYRLYYYKSRPWALKRMEHLLHLAIVFNTHESIRFVEEHK